MPVIKQQGLFTPTITPESFTEGLKLALTAAGYGTIYAEFDDNGNKNLVYQVVSDTTKTFETLYLHFQIGESLQVDQRLHTAFDTDTNTGSNLDQSHSSNGFSSDNPLQWIALNNGSEFRFVMLYQASQSICLGMIRPLGIPGYWDENIAPYALVPDLTKTILQYFLLPEVSPYTANSYIKSSWLGSIISSKRNPFNNEIDILTRLVFAPQSKQGIFGMSSSLIALATDNLLTIGDLISLPDGSEYCTIALAASSSAVVVRTTDAI